MKKVFLSLILIYFFLLILPLAASAIEYPFGNMSANPSPCEYISVVFVWGLGIVGAVAVTSIAYGGFMYMVGKVEQGKEIIYSALLGLLLLMTSWLILYTINPELATLNCQAPKVASSTTTTGPSTGPSTGPRTAPSSLSDTAVRNELTTDSNGKITVNKTCGSAKQSNTTCVDGLQRNTIDGVENIQKGCNCDVIITGGTENGHAPGTYSHSNGYKLDLGMNNPTLNTYVNNQIGTSNPTPYKPYKGTDGNTYMYETGPPHWDVCFKC